MNGTHSPGAPLKKKSVCHVMCMKRATPVDAHAESGTRRATRVGRSLLVQLCTTDPARLREVVAETVRARTRSCTSAGASSPVASLFPVPSAVVVEATKNVVAASSTSSGTTPAPVDETGRTAGAGAKVESAGGAAGMAAKAAAAAGMPGVGAAINKGATMTVPEDPEQAVGDYVEAALLKIPDEILGVIFRNALLGPSAMLLVGVLLGLLAEGTRANGTAGGLMLVISTLLVGFGLFGVATAYVTYCLSRTMLHTMLHALVSQQVAAVRKTKQLFTDLGNSVSATFSNVFSYGAADDA